MNRLRSVGSVLGAAALVMAAGACGSGTSGPLDATAVDGGQGTGTQANLRPSPSPSPSATPSPAPTPSPSPGGEDNAELRGTIQSVSAPNFTVNGRLIRTNASTRFLDRNNNATGFGALSAGQPVEVEGNAQADGSVLAFKVKLEDEVGDDNPGDDNGGHGGDDNGGDDNGGHGGDDNGGDDHGGSGGGLV
jgi:Domain of unknown function (DUF5666)